MSQVKINSMFDITKLVLAIAIVLIHCNILPNILYPWLRIAVPLFFVISSYFFFNKINKVNNKSEKNIIIKKFVIRNMKLYLFYFALLIPFTIIVRDYFYDSNIFYGFCRFIRSLLFSSTFIASWYIMALVIGTLIIYFLSTKLKNKYLLVISLITYILVCIRSSYSYMYINNSNVSLIINIYEKIFTAGYNSFPVALIWIFIGKLFAENKFCYNKRINYFIFCISVFLLWAEWLYIKNITGNLNNDCYIFIIPIVISIFKIIIDIKPFEIKYSKEIRNFSTMTYAIHGTICPTLNRIFDSFFGFKNNYITFILTITICIIFFIIVRILQKSNKLNILKNAF